jgi:hypothetical protein
LIVVTMFALHDEWHSYDRDEQGRRLRQLARWYRELAERAGNPVIWEARLHTAERLEWEAEQLAEGSKRR